MNKRQFSKNIREYRPEWTISTHEITYFYNIYKNLLKLCAKDPAKLATIRETYKYTNINTCKFRDALCDRLLIELTPRQAELYIDVLTMVLVDKNT